MNDAFLLSSAPLSIETDRLILRTVGLEDAAQVAASWNLDDEPLGLAEAQDVVRWMQANHAQNVPGKVYHLCLALITKDSQTIIGWCGLDQRDSARDCPVLFYLLKADSWGKGLATEAAQALLGLAFGPLGLNQIEGGAEVGNIASKRVMEKIGMEYLGLNAEGGHAFRLRREDYLTHRKETAEQ